MIFKSPSGTGMTLTAAKELRPGITIEEPTRHDQEALLRLLNEVVRPESTHPIEQDLPLLVGPKANSHQRIVRTEGRIVAHAAMYVHSYRLLNHAFNVGVIGAVATAESERGRGFGSALIQELLSHAVDCRIPLCVLWAQATSFYERNGFVSAGREIIHVATRDEMPLPTADTKVREATRADLPALRIIHNQEPSLTVRTSPEWEAWMQLPGTAFYVLENRAGIISYAVVGKGQDLQGCIHEWGGPEHQLPCLVGGVFKLRTEDELYVMSAPWKQTACKVMTALGTEQSIGVLGMLQVLDATTFCNSLGTPHVDEQTMLEHEALVPLIFGCGDVPPDDLQNPLPFYLFGLDSM